MFTTEDFIIAVFCCVDDFFQVITHGSLLRKRGFAPTLGDSEVITMEIVGEFLGIDTDTDIWKYFRNHWSHFFPQLVNISRSSFARQGANLWQYKQVLQQRFAKALGAFDDNVHLIDGIPIPLCCFTRAHGCRLFRGESDYGYCAAKDQVYYGFRGHLVVSAIGVITGFTLTPANGSEREAVWDIIGGIRGLLIGDKGYIDGELGQQLQGCQINLQTPLRSNMKDQRNPNFVRLLTRCRRLIETVIGQLCERFNLQKVRARDIWHLTNRINRKLLAHTVCIWLNRFSLFPLQFEQLIPE
jgi:hypothetical protein